MSRPRESFEERFWKKIDRANDNECWLWTAKSKALRNPGAKNGFTPFRLASYEINIGKVPDGLYCLPRCGNNICANPNHLFLSKSHYGDIEASIIRFWNKVNKKTNNECWEWNGFLDNQRYGRFVYLGKRICSHRFSWEIHFGKIPEKLLICHTCDNPACVNPKHLFLGTHRDNAQDKVEKGRWAGNENQKGELHSQSKLTKQDVLTIRQMYATGKYSQTNLSKIFKISRRQIGNIVNKRQWTHI